MLIGTQACARSRMGIPVRRTQCYSSPRVGRRCRCGVHIVESTHTRICSSDDTWHGATVRSMQNLPHERARSPVNTNSRHAQSCNQQHMLAPGMFMTARADCAPLASKEIDQPCTKGLAAPPSRGPRAGTFYQFFNKAYSSDFGLS